MSLRTKNRREAAFRVRWFLFEMDCLLERLKSMDDQEKQQSEYEGQAAELRARLERKANDLPVETAQKVRDQLRQIEVVRNVSSIQKEYADQLDSEAEDRSRIVKKQADALRRLAKRYNVKVNVDKKADALEEYALNSIEHSKQLVNELRSQSQKQTGRAQKLSDEIPALVLQNMIETEHRSGGKSSYNERLSVIAEDFFIEKDGIRRNEKDRQALRRHVTHFIQLLGDPVVRDLTTSMLLEARRKCKLLPPEHKKEVRGKTAPQMLALGLASRSLQTTNNQLTSVRSFFRWAKEHRRAEHDDSGVIKDFPVNTEQETSKRRSWTLEELQKLFDSYIYRYDELAVGKRHGNQKIQEGCFWVPLIALYTGARAEEICSLKPEHIVEIDGIWCFDMVEFDEEGNRNKKNPFSVRVFPVHRQLIDFGLIKYAEQRTAANKSKLFDLKGYKGKLSHYFSKWFNGTFKKGVGFKVGGNIEKSEVVFHSFRNNAIEEFEIAGLEESSYSRVTGHSTGGVARRTYPFKGKKIFPPKPLVDVVNVITHEGLDLSHVSFEKFKSVHVKAKRKSRARQQRARK